MIACGYYPLDSVHTGSTYWLLALQFCLTNIAALSNHAIELEIEMLNALY